ncbi:hypothetical protein VF21_06377 [Pseudogymnoascus sp. 05NY08]|nr:hypothetical protein VF21_06377 [Pseudogymnoascus sp. 05NY08]
MELAIPVPPRIYFEKDDDCKCCLGHHFEDSHIHSCTMIDFDISKIYSPCLGPGMITLAHEYTCKPSMSMLAQNWIEHTECTEDCQIPNRVNKKCFLNSPEMQGSGTKKKEKLDNTVSAFLALPREIRNDIYVRVLGSSRDHWAVMTASIPSPKTGPPNPKMSHMTFEYSCGSRPLQLLCHQVRNEILEVCQSWVQDIRLCELGVSDLEAVLDTFEHKEVLRLSARNITLFHSTPMLSDGFSFLSQFIEPFQSLIKLCPNVESVFVSLVLNSPSGSRTQFCLYIPCHDRDEFIEVQVDDQWYKVAEWESIIRLYFNVSFEEIEPDGKHGVLWIYSCGCVAGAYIDIIVSDEERMCAILGARRINATIKEMFINPDGDEEHEVLD